MEQGNLKSQPDNAATFTESEPLVVRHQWQSLDVGTWKSEAWLSTTSVSYVGPIPIWMRLTPRDADVPTAPDALMVLKLVRAKDGSVLKEVTVRPSFQDCSKMKKHREATYQTETRSWGKEELFPPKGPCYQCVLKDPFESDGRAPNAQKLEPGEMLLMVDVRLDDGSRGTYNAIKIKVRRYSRE